MNAPAPLCAPPCAQARQQLWFINFGHLFTHYSLLVLPTAVLAMARPGGAFGAEYGPILQLATAGLVFYGLFSLPQGWLAARLGRHTLMALFYLGTGGALAAAGLCRSPLALAAALGLSGLFSSIYHPVGTAMLVEAAGDRPGRAIGFNGVCGNMGVALAPMATAFLAAHAGWQAAFVVPGLICVAVGLLWLRMSVTARASLRSARPFPVIPRPLVRRAVAVLLMIAVASGLVFNAFTLLLPKLIAERMADDPRLLPLVGVGAFLAMAVGALSQFTVGRLIDRFTLKRVFLPLGVMLVPALVALAFARGWLVLPVAGCVAASIFGQVTVNETMTARYISPELRTKMYSLRFFLGFLGSAASAPLVAMLYQRTGSLVSSVLVLAAFGIVTLLCALAFPNRREELNPELWATATARHPGAAAPAPAE